MTISVVSGPSHAASGGFHFNTTDGSFDYTPAAGYVGTDSFTYKVNDGHFDSNVATVTINLTNHAPVAENDLAEITFAHLDAPVEIHVLGNDYDADGDPIWISDVSSPARGGSVCIDPSGLSIWYTLPPESATSFEQGGEIPIVENYPEDQGTAGERPEVGGFGAFQDTFNYTITDSAGSTGNAFCQINTNNQPEWTVKLNDQYKTAKKVGIDGQPGYFLKIEQTFGANARRRAARGTQTWQKNVEIAQNVYLDANGQIHYEKPGERVLADVHDIKPLSPAPVVSNFNRNARKTHARKQFGRTSTQSDVSETFRCHASTASIGRSRPKRLANCCI